jgi:cytosine/adenosine deaminase-related metal-dependent hydrolase
MTEARAQRASRRFARHEHPAIDEAGLVAARHADRLLAAAREIGSERWVVYLEPLPDRLRDDDPTALRATATRSRAAYGVKDSIRDVLPESLTEPFLDSIDRLIRELNRARG